MWGESKILVARGEKTTKTINKYSLTPSLTAIDMDLRTFNDNGAPKKDNAGISPLINSLFVLISAYGGFLVSVFGVNRTLLWGKISQQQTLVEA